MRFARHFIDRPVLAGVLSLAILLTGLVSMRLLPVAMFPEVVPPTIVVSASYPGANPKVVAETVASPLEQEINGIEGVLYMSSSSGSDGTLQLGVTFEIGTDVDKAQMLVQNRVSQALPRLPEEVRALGVATTKSSPDLLMVVHLVSDERYDPTYLRNLGLLQVRDRLLRLPGVGQVALNGGGDYAMRIWLDPQQVAARGLTAGDVVRAIREQNLQVAAGTVGAPPAAAGTAFQLTVTAGGRLKTPEEFGAIVVKANPEGGITRLSDIGRVELGAGSYLVRSGLDNHPAVAVAINQAPGANALALAAAVRAEMADIAKNFPEGVHYEVPYDPTQFVKESIEAVVHTLLEATLLVVIVVVLFLQSWRASIIPLLAVPVSVIGTMGALLAFGFSINTLSLFGLVLSIGIVVDDAIVVVENVERNIAAGFSPREATVRAMDEVTGPIIAIALVLCAVFIPIAFIPGLTGRFYQQFALTIAASTIISAFNSLTLSPALSAALLRPHGAPPDRVSAWLEKYCGGFFARFNRGFARSGERYEVAVKGTLPRKGRMLAIYGVLVVLGALVFRQVPPGFVPSLDVGSIITYVQMPDAATIDRTEKVAHRVGDLLLADPNVEHVIQFTGLSVKGFAPNPSSAMMFVRLKPYPERTGKELTAQTMVPRLQKLLAPIKEARVGVVEFPPVRGLGLLGGVSIQIEDRAGLGYDALFAATQTAVAKAAQTPGLAGGFSSYSVNVPQLRVEVDRTRAKEQGLQLNDVYQTLQVYLGSLYVNDLNLFGRTYRVMVQADAPYRSRAEDIRLLQTRNNRGEMVPLASVIDVTPSNGPDRVYHYNGFLAADLNVAGLPGVASGDALAATEKILRDTLPNGLTYEFSDLTLQEKLAGNSALMVFPLCVVLVFLVLAALYESWTLPLAVVLIVPLCILAALTGVWLTGGDNNIFTQVALFVLVGLACKNAILIVEFAKLRQDHGLTAREAALEACRLRLRPILMTSIAFIAGVVPLVFATGAGAEMRHAIGISVFFGMLGVTAFGLLLTPSLFVMVQEATARWQHPRASAHPEIPHDPSHDADPSAGQDERGLP